ncbi:hypothetical protein EON82_05815 [bacterium]|nr:MAG: hypothetical protein EON82_05815 [bacterium]
MSALAASLLIAGAAQASPTSLFLMPIADCLKKLEGFTYIGLGGTERNVSKAYYYYQAVTVGLGHNLEVGYDSDLMGTLSGNVKYQLFENPKFAPNMALSVGVSNWRGDAVDPYLVGRYDGKGYRLHAGYWRTMGTDRLMLGTDFPVAPGFSGSVEFLSGPNSQSWASLYYEVPFVPGLLAGIAVGVPSDHRDGLQHSALLYYSFKL